MSSTRSQRGFAIALLLWMIAGMSLTVAAVIHFARADIGMAEVRIAEARAQTAGRGVALLALRDRELKNYQLGSGVDQVTVSAIDVEAGDESPQVFAKRYQFKEDEWVTATLRPANGYVSLNDETSERLLMLLGELSGSANVTSMQIVQEILEYRRDSPGFRFPEELLGVPGLKRVVYDRIRPHVHAFRTGSIDLEHAPKQLASMLNDDADSGQSEAEVAASGSARNGSYSGPSDMTFEAIAERIRNPGGVTDSNVVVAAEILFEVPGAGFLKQLIWLDSRSGRASIRTGSLTLSHAEPKSK